MRKGQILEGHCGSRRAWARPVIRRWRPHTMPSALLSSDLVINSPYFVQPSPTLNICNLFSTYKCMLNKYNYSLEQCLDELFWGLSRIWDVLWYKYSEWFDPLYSGSILIRFAVGGMCVQMCVCACAYAYVYVSVCARKYIGRWTVPFPLSNDHVFLLWNHVFKPLVHDAFNW